MIFPFDTECCLLSPGVQAPPLVCLQFKIDDSPPQLIHARDPACRRTVMQAIESAAIWNGHNVAFDIVVLMAQWPDLVEPLFDLLDRDQVTCTIVRQKLRDIATGRFKVASKRGYDLGTVGRIYGVEVNKDDPWRMRYGTLYGVPVEQWPAEAVTYALQDAVAQHAVYVGQEGKRFSSGLQGLADGVDLFADQYRQTRAAVWMRLMECRGIRTDPQRVEQYIADVRATLEEDRAVCLARELVRPDGTRDTKRAQAYMLQVCREADEKDFPVTATGEKTIRVLFKIDKNQPLPVGVTWRALERGPVAVSLDEDSCRIYGDEVLEAYQRYSTSTTQLARAERLKHGLIQSRFGTLQDTGRTSCSQGDRSNGAHGAQLQNPAKDKKLRRKQPSGWLLDGDHFFDPLTGERRPVIVMRKGTRECFIPRPGFYFCSTDYSGMELCGWAQVCIWTVRSSRLADVMNSGTDAHAVLGATLAKISVEEALARLSGARGEALQKEFKGRYRQLAKIANFGFQGGMGHKKLRLQARKQYEVTLSEQEAYDLRIAWLQTWPEAQRYFDWVNYQIATHTDGVDEKGRPAMGKVLQFRSNRVRGRCWYSALANTMFQGLCADIAKEACWRIAREMYTGRRYDTRALSPLAGGRLVNFLHDEAFSELPIATAHEAAFRQAEIQIKTAEEWAPDLVWRCEPALMEKGWYKDAEAVYQDGKLVPWVPKEAA